MMTTLLRLTLLVTLLWTTNCGQAGISRKDNDSQECLEGVCTDIPFAIKTQKTEGIISQRQLVPNFQQCLGLTAISGAGGTRDAFIEAQPSLPLDGSVKDLSAPMLMAIAKVTSEMCLDLVNQEKNSSNRKFFPGFTINGNSVDAAQTFDMKKTLQTLSNSCWGRKITDTEASIITSKITTKDTAAAIVACTVVLSSAEAVRF